jgi:hypothetical protein
MQFNTRTIVYCILIFLMGYILSGCREDIQVIKPGPSIPVVYAVFDLSQSMHYVKISKTFAGKSDPYTLALNADNIFYPGVEVFLSQGIVGARFPFYLVNSIPRVPGDFPENPNEVFVLNQLLNAGNYLLTVVLPTEKDTLTANFNFINAFKVVTPKTGFKRFYFYEDPILFTWIADASAGLYEITFNLEYEEYMKNGVILLSKAAYTRQLNPAELEFENGRYTFRFFSDSFFAKMGTVILPKQELDYRKPVGLELIITAADTTIARYLNWFNLEIDDKVNPNGNVDGAIGVVGTKMSVPFTNLTLSSRSQDSLVKGKYTKKLGFINNPEW